MRKSGPIHSRARTAFSNSNRTSSVSGLEKFDGVAGGIFKDDLRPADTCHNLVAEPQPGGPEPLHFGCEIRNRQLNPISAAGDRLAAIRHRARS